MHRRDLAINSDNDNTNANDKKKKLTFRDFRTGGSHAARTKYSQFLCGWVAGRVACSTRQFCSRFSNLFHDFRAGQGSATIVFAIFAQVGRGGRGQDEQQEQQQRQQQQQQHHYQQEQEEEKEEQEQEQEREREREQEQEKEQ